MWQQILVMAIVKVIERILENSRKFNDCPDGVCAESLVLAASISDTVASPSVKVGANVGGILDLIQCVPFDRVIAVAKRALAVLQDAKSCPENPSLFNILGCLDIPEVVSICKEVLDIINESRICDDDNRVGVSVSSIAN